MLNKIIKILKPKFNKNYDLEFMSKLTLLNLMFILIISISTAFSIYHFIFDNTTAAIVLISYASITLLLSLYLKASKEYEIGMILAVSLLGSLFFWITITGNVEYTGVLWSLIFPVISLLLLNNKKGIIVNLIYISLIIVFFIFPNEKELLTEYTGALKIRFVITYFILFFTLIIYKTLKSHSVITKEKELLEIKKKVKEKNNFVSNLSFRIRTPLNNIVGILNLKSDSLDKEVIDEIELSINNLITIINSIPNFSETKVKFLKPENKHFNLTAAIKDSLKLYTTEDYDNLKFSLNISNKISANLTGNKLAVKQIIISIIDFYYKNNTANSTKIDFIITEKENQKKGDSYILFKIKSNMSMDIFKGFESENSFADFSKLNNNELTIIDSIIKSIDGKLNIYYDGDTTAFLFTLPFAENKQENTNTLKNKDTEENIKTVDHKKIDLSKAHVLLVEDDKVNQKIMVMSLRKHVENIEVAENGKEALIKFGKTKYDIILMDIRMPLMDGFKTTMKIREAEAGTNSKIPIIAVTANALSGDREKCLDAGMDEYISKPFNKKELITKMTEQLS